MSLTNCQSAPSPLQSHYIQLSLFLPFITYILGVTVLMVVQFFCRIERLFTSHDNAIGFRSAGRLGKGVRIYLLRFYMLYYHIYVNIHSAYTNTLITLLLYANHLFLII